MTGTADADRIRQALAAGARSGVGVDTSQVKNAHPSIPLQLGQRLIPWDLETRHILMVGTTGSGKSQAIYRNLEAIRARNQSAILMDHSAEFLQRFYRPGVDVIFNPFDKRGVGWNVFNEIRRIFDFDRIAQACIPDDSAGSNKDWQMGARELFANTLRQLWKLGKPFRTNKMLVHFLSHAPLRGAFPTDNDGRPIKSMQHFSLEELLRGTTSQRMFEPGNERGLPITMTIISRYLTPFTYLKDGDFSVSDFVRSFEQGGDGRWLFMAYTDANYAAIQSIFGFLASTAISAGLELSESQERRFFYVLDELPSLGKLPALDDALTKLRKRGGVVIAGIQSTAQIEDPDTYGRTGGQILLSCFGSVMMLRVMDDQTAEKLSAMIGDVERWEENESSNLSSSSGVSGASSSESSGVSRSLQVRRAVLPSEFYTLPDLTGYARIGGTRMPHDAKTGRPYLAKVEYKALPIVAEKEQPIDGLYLLDDMVAA